MLAKECSTLMRILAVTHGLHLPVLQVEGIGKICLLAIKAHRTQVVGNGTVVARRVLKRLYRQFVACCQRCLALVLLQFCKHRGIICTVDQNRHCGMILGRRTQQGRPTDIDIFDGHGQVTVITCNGLFKGIEIDHDHVDRCDVVGLHDGLIGTPACEDATVYFWMQRLDAAGHHLGKTGVVGDLYNGYARLCQQLRGTTG